MVVAMRAGERAATSPVACATGFGDGAAHQPRGPRAPTGAHYLLASGRGQGGLRKSHRRTFGWFTRCEKGPGSPLEAPSSRVAPYRNTRNGATSAYGVTAADSDARGPDLERRARCSAAFSPASRRPSSSPGFRWSSRGWCRRRRPDRLSAARASRCRRTGR